jgi:myo-inositol-1(or 4)-monophosphatase
MDELLNTAIQIARQAGAILRAGFGQARSVDDYKGGIELVTEYDQRSEALILAGLQAVFPDHQILAEESGQIDSSSSYCWVVDPLDGTVNFAHGVPGFAVSIGLRHAGKPLLGVVYDPLRDELFAGQQGQLPTLNNQPIRVSTVTDLRRGLVATGFPYDKASNPDNNGIYVVRALPQVQDLRRAGSAALDLSYVAAGRYAGYWELRLKPWDFAAGALLVQLAGGVITDLNGSDAWQQSGSVVCGNPIFQAQLLKVLQAT